MPIGDGERFVQEEAWTALLSLAVHPHVFVKVSALFRLTAPASAGDFAALQPRLERLLQAYGSERLLWGSDFPFALDHGGAALSWVHVSHWCTDDKQATDLLCDTAERLYGSFAKTTLV